MKLIVKEGQPQDYTNWRNQMKGNVNERYPVPDPPRQQLVNQLLYEQGFLCGYTMRRIDNNSCHIEHIKPETVCRAELRGSDLNYENMIACFPKKRIKKQTEYCYGAVYKDDWWDNNGIQFVSPLNPICEVRFDFNLKGEIIAINADAELTVDVLCLDHKSLTEDRRRVIEEFIYGPAKDDPLSVSKVDRAIQSIVERKADGTFYEFCVALQKAMQAYKINLAKAAAKKKFAAQARKK